MKSCPYLDKVLVVLLLLFAAGCEVTKDKIDIWKQSDKGAAKLRACVQDVAQTVDIRIECAQALAEMGLVYYLSKDLNVMSVSDKKKITADLAQKLVASMKGSNLKETNNVKLGAKDALFSIRGMLDAKQRVMVDTEVVRWILTDSKERSKGAHSADKIIRTAKSVAGPLLAEAIAQGGTRPLSIAFMLREVGSQADRDSAAKKLVALAQKEKKPSIPTLEALGRVGSLHATEHLMTVAREGDDDTRMFAL